MKRILLSLFLATSAIGVANAGDKPNDNIGRLLWDDQGRWRPWSQIVKEATAMSARHNVGANRKAPLKIHICKPDDKRRCLDSVYIGVNNDPPWRWMAVITHFESNVESTRYVCWYTADQDMRQCKTYGDGEDGPVEKQNEKGEWVVELQGDSI